MPAFRAAPIAAAITCIWTSALVPSCIRAPPEATTLTTGRRRAVAVVNARAILVPSATPREPPRKAYSKPTSTQGRPPTRARPVVTACRAPAASRARRSRLRYPGQPLGLPASASSPNGARLPGSATSRYSGPGR